MPKALFNVRQSGPFIREWADGFCEHDKGLHLDAWFPAPRPEHGSFRADNVTQIEILQQFVLIAKHILAQVKLYGPGRVLKIDKRRLAHTATRHHPSSENERLRLSALTLFTLDNVQSGPCGNTV